MRWIVFWWSLSILWLAVRNKTHPLKKPRRGRKEAKKEAEDTLLFIQGIKAAQLLGILIEFLLHLYFTCGTDRVNDSTKSFHLKIGKERCFSLNKEKQISRNFLK